MTSHEPFQKQQEASSHWNSNGRIHRVKNTSHDSLLLAGASVVFCGKQLAKCVDDPFLLGPGNFSGGELLNFRKVIAWCRLTLEQPTVSELFFVPENHWMLHPRMFELMRETPRLQLKKGNRFFPSTCGTQWKAMTIRNFKDFTASMPPFILRGLPSLKLTVRT